MIHYVEREAATRKAYEDELAKETPEEKALREKEKRLRHFLSSLPNLKQRTCIRLKYYKKL